jgi:hypothetical protein
MVRVDGIARPGDTVITDRELLAFLEDVAQACPRDHPELRELCRWAQVLIGVGVFDAKYNRKSTCGGPPNSNPGHASDAPAVTRARLLRAHEWRQREGL